MNLRYDIVSETTGKVLLSAALDAPPDGLSRREIQRVLTILRKCKASLELVMGYGNVQLRLDDYDSLVFWYIVLLRGIVFDPTHPTLGNRTWSIYELLLNPKLAPKLKRTDLGVVYDEQRNWLSLVWPEALGGVLQGIELCPSWKRILEREEKRQGKPITPAWWKICARMNAFTVPPWHLSRLDYLHQVLWHRPSVTYEDVIVLDLAGIDLPRIQCDFELPTARQARFTHFYTDDEREFRDVHRIRISRAQRDPAYQRRLAARKEQRESQRVSRKSWWLASRTVYDLARIFDAPRIGGSTTRYLSPSASDRMFDAAMSRFLTGAPIDRHKKRIDALVAELEALLQDPVVPREFSRWLQFKEGGSAIQKERRDRANQPSTE